MGDSFFDICSSIVKYDGNLYFIGDVSRHGIHSYDLKAFPCVRSNNSNDKSSFKIDSVDYDINFNDCINLVVKEDDDKLEFISHVSNEFKSWFDYVKELAKDIYSRESLEFQFEKFFVLVILTIANCIGGFIPTWPFLTVMSIFLGVSIAGELIFEYCLGFGKKEFNKILASIINNTISSKDLNNAIKRLKKIGIEVVNQPSNVIDNTSNHSDRAIEPTEFDQIAPVAHQGSELDKPQQDTKRYVRNGQNK